MRWLARILPAMSLPAGTSNTNAPPRFSTLSLIIGLLVGICVGPVSFFFLYLLAIPIGLVVGLIVGGYWGRRNPITTTGFASLGVVLAEVIFVLGERFLQLPTRAIAWFAAPIVGALGFWLLPYLARALWPNLRDRENAAIIAFAAFLILPWGLFLFMPRGEMEADSDSFKLQTGFYLSCDALAQAEGHHATRHYPPQPAPHLLALRSFPELCCPGIAPSLHNQEVPIGDWRITMNYVTRAQFADTVGYYRGVVSGGVVQQKPVNVLFPCTRITGTVRGEPVSVIIADVPKRGVGVVIF